jgi:hypothetical protein
MAASKGQPDVRITVHRLFGEPRDFTLSYPLDPDHHEMLATIHREFGGRRGRDGQVIEDRMHPRLPRATPGVPGGWLTIASIRDPLRGVDARRWRLGHWPGSGPGGHDVPSRMSIDHLQSQEYVGLRIDEHGGGFRGVTEKSVAKGTVSDVVAFDRGGSPAATLEIQYSGQSDGRAVRRDRAVERAGIPAAWLGPTDSRPGWAAKVAWLGANRREGMARGSWTVASGRRAIEMEPCRPGARQDCHFGRNWCYDEHPLWRPRGGTVDDIVDGIIAGDLRRFDTGKGLVVATPADCQRWIDYCGAPKIARRAAAAAQREAAEKGLSHNSAYSEAKILASMRLPSEWQPRTCAACNRQESEMVDELCSECHQDYIIATQFPVLAGVTSSSVPVLTNAQQGMIELVSAMQSYGELVGLWRLARRGGVVTPHLIDACRQRRAEIDGVAS